MSLPIQKNLISNCHGELTGKKMPIPVAKGKELELDIWASIGEERGGEEILY